VNDTVQLLYVCIT